MSREALMLACALAGLVGLKLALLAADYAPVLAAWRVAAKQTRFGGLVRTS